VSLVFLLFHGTVFLGDRRIWLMASITIVAIGLCKLVELNRTHTTDAEVTVYRTSEDERIHVYKLGKLGHEHGYLHFSVTGLQSRNKPFTLVTTKQGEWCLYIKHKASPRDAPISNWARQVMDRCDAERGTLPVTVCGPWPVGDLSSAHAITNYRAWVLVAFDTGFTGVGAVLPFAVRKAQYLGKAPRDCIQVFCRSRNVDYLRVEVAPMVSDFGIEAWCSSRAASGVVHREEQGPFWESVRKGVSAFTEHTDIREIAIMMCGSNKTAEALKQNFKSTDGYHVFVEAFGS
jgi:hypothetical protein